MKKGQKIRQKIIPSKNLSKKITWWGFSQWYKFRWHKTHIDLGIISIYELPQKGIGKIFWSLIAIIIKPLRIWYHKKHVYSIKAQIKNLEKEINF